MHGTAGCTPLTDVALEQMCTQVPNRLSCSCAPLLPHAAGTGAAACGLDRRRRKAQGFRGTRAGGGTLERQHRLARAYRLLLRRFVH
jgi:hypothetical protein